MTAAGEVLRCFGASLLAGPRAEGSSCHTSQQAGSCHWAPPGPVQARFPPLPPQLSYLLCGPVIIGTMCLVKLLRQWKVTSFPGRCVWEAGPGPADGGFSSPVTPPPPTPLLCPLRHRAAERGGQPTPALRPNDRPLLRRHLCTCPAEVRCPARAWSGRCAQARAEMLKLLGR
ncbi:unnamed protein product [Rangifer tarandus platyrhynchus]|uniref:Uncharacterized protein n=1 Tax=Rangifer tarandus platyrhynchus TaxID=3082113 RepID=A0AC59Y1U9_RANTA